MKPVLLWRREYGGDRTALVSNTGEVIGRVHAIPPRMWVSSIAAIPYSNLDRYAQHATRAEGMTRLARYFATLYRSRAS